MKKAVILVALSLLTLLIVLPIKSFVNHPLGNPTLLHPTLRGDGSPMPPLPPKKLHRDSASLVADGSPIPPLPPKKRLRNSTFLIADGSPIPPLPPKKLHRNFGAALMIA